MNYLPILIAGITTGGLTCFAVQGGLLTSVLTQIKKNQTLVNENSSQSSLIPAISFVIAKISVYTVFGALLGFFGAFFSLSTSMQAWIQIFVAVYMIGVALQLLNLHPVFRYFIIQPPASLQRLVRKVAKGKDELTTPILLGAMTLVIPCGTTLAMEALAISSGNALTGALILFIFTTASSWIFIALGLVTNFKTVFLQKYFNPLTASLLIILGIISLNGGLNLLGFPYTLNSGIFNSKSQVLGIEKEKSTTGQISADFTVQKVTMQVTSSGYKPNITKLKKNVPVELTLETHNTYTCAIAFTIPKLGIQKVLPPDGKEVITFTPKDTGQLAYSCSMGMYRGNFVVVE